MSIERRTSVGREDAVVYNTFIVPKEKPTTVNIPGNERRCGPPSDVELH